MNSHDCSHIDLKCRRCMREGDRQYFTREEWAKAGFSTYNPADILDHKDMNYISEMMYDAVRELHPDVDIENLQWDWEWSLFIKAEESEDA